MKQNKYVGFVATFNRTLKWNSLTLLHSWTCVSRVVMMQRWQNVFMGTWLYITGFSRKKNNETLDHTTANLLAITDNWLIYMH